MFIVCVYVLLICSVKIFKNIPATFQIYMAKITLYKYMVCTIQSPPRLSAVKTNSYLHRSANNELFALFLKYGIYLHPLNQSDCANYSRHAINVGYYMFFSWFSTRWSRVLNHEKNVIIHLLHGRVHFDIFQFFSSPASISFSQKTVLTCMLPPVSF